MRKQSTYVSSKAISRVKRHATPWKRKFPTKRSWFDKNKKGKCTHKSWRLNNKGTASVTGRRWLCKLLVCTDPTNEDSTRVKQKIRILDHPKNLLDVPCARLKIDQGLTGNNITMGPNQYRFTQTFLDGEVLRIFDLKSTELRHETVFNLILVMDHVVTYFVPK